MSQETPALYGIENSNRAGDELWSKNVFNSTFPIALACYMRDNRVNPVYISLDERINHFATDDRINFNDVFGLRGKNRKIKFDFETPFKPFDEYCYDNLPPIDLAIRTYEGVYKRPIEIKLTVLPDDSTAHLSEDQWGSELVLRPVSSAYATLSLIDSMVQDATLKKRVRSLVEPIATSIQDWNNVAEVRSRSNEIMECISQTLKALHELQKPFLLQQIWKTQGKSPLLAERCFDIFLWSDAALLKSFLDAAQASKTKRVSRALRECTRTLRCINEVVVTRKIRYSDVYAGMGLGNLNDKSASLSGRTSSKYMQHPRLLRPTIKREALRQIILNHGERMLSPERRFDASIYFTCKELLK